MSCPVTAAQFWAMVQRDGKASCWPWPRYRLPEGYGRIKWQGMSWTTHRLAWMLTYGPIPEGLCVLHHCDNPPCCNPTHLWLGTHADNVDDMIRKGRQGKKLDQERADAIRHAAGRSMRDIAAEYGVSASLVCGIRRGKNWVRRT